MRRTSGKISPFCADGAWKNVPATSSVFIIFRLINTTNSWQNGSGLTLRDERTTGDGQ